MERAELGQYLIKPEMTIRDAIKQMNKIASSALFLVDAKGALKATLTDEDIRAALIKGSKFTQTVKKIASDRVPCLSLKESDSKERVRALLLKNRLLEAAVVDSRGNIVDVVLLDRLESGQKRTGKVKRLRNKVVIMAGGKGSRLEPFTRVFPKPLIPIEEKPIIEILMERFYKYGLSNFIFTLNYKKEYVKMFLKESNFPYNVDWVEENEYMGTAGSISLLKGKIDDTFIVSNCDTIVDADYGRILEWHKKRHSMMTIIGCHREIDIPYGILDIRDGRLQHFREKPVYDMLVNTGVYVMEPEVIKLVSNKGRLDMNVLIQNVAKRGKVSVYPIHRGWFDTGQWGDFNKSFQELCEL